MASNRPNTRLPRFLDNAQTKEIAPAFKRADSNDPETGLPLGPEARPTFLRIQTPLQTATFQQVSGQSQKQAEPLAAQSAPKNPQPQNTAQPTRQSVVTSIGANFAEQSLAQEQAQGQSFAAGRKFDSKQSNLQGAANNPADIEKYDNIGNTRQSLPTQQAPVPSQAMLEQLASAIGELKAVRLDLAKQARADALEIAFQIAKRILEAELSSGRETMMRLVQSALKRLGSARRIKIRLSPLDAAAMRETTEFGDSQNPLTAQKAHQDESNLGVAEITILADATLARGDCIVESEFGSVDGRLDTRIAELRKTIDAAINGPEENAA